MMVTYLVLQRESDSARYEEQMQNDMGSWIKIAHAVEQGGKAWIEGRQKVVKPASTPMEDQE